MSNSLTTQHIFKAFVVNCYTLGSTKNQTIRCQWYILWDNATENVIILWRAGVGLSDIEFLSSLKWLITG